MNRALRALDSIVVLHPFALGLGLILLFASGQVGRTSWPSLFISCALLAGLVAMNLAFWLIWVRDRRRAAIVASAVVMVVFSYNTFQFVLQAAFGRFGDAGRGRIVAPVACVILVLIIWTVLRSRRSFVLTTRILNFVGAVGLLVAVGILAKASVNTIYALTELRATTLPAAPGGTIVDGSRPNIYYIIFDGYAGWATLRDTYGYDNDDFMRFLHERGFYVADEARSNYASTFLSLASTLNMRYVNGLATNPGSASMDRTIPNGLIRQSTVMRLLREHGYRLVHFRSGWATTDCIDDADVIVDCGGWPLLLAEFADTTMIAPAFGYVGALSSAQRRRMRCEFERLSGPVDSPSPYIVFAHLLIPHPPFIFGPNGEPRADDTPENSGAGWAGKQRYLDQLTFVNKNMKTVLEALVRRDPSAVIVVQSDHGPAASGRWDNPSTEFLRERMRILAAFRWPGPRDSLYRTVTPVNIFPLVFNTFLGMHLPLQRDTSYFSSYDRPYELRDVTPIVSDN